MRSAAIYLGIWWASGARPRPSAGPLLAIGVVLHLADIGVRCTRGVNPISSTPEAMSLVAFLIAAGYLVTSLRYTLLMALTSPLGPLLAAFTSDRLERKWTIVALSCCLVVIGLVFFQARAPWQVVLCGALLRCACTCSRIGSSSAGSSTG
jgi:hypothetical protein